MFFLETWFLGVSESLDIGEEAYSAASQAASAQERRTARCPRTARAGGARAMFRAAALFEGVGGAASGLGGRRYAGPGRPRGAQGV